MWVSFLKRIGEMGEFSAMNAIKSILNNSPSMCASGIKFSKILCQRLRNSLKIHITKELEDAEIDGIYI